MQLWFQPLRISVQRNARTMSPMIRWSDITAGIVIIARENRDRHPGIRQDENPLVAIANRSDHFAAVNTRTSVS